MNVELPDKLNFGSGDLVELDYLCQVFAIPRKTASLYLKALCLKPMHVGKKVFFSLPTLKRILFVLSLPDSPGFLFPGSAGRGNKRLLENPGYLTQVTPEILKKAADPKILAEMCACEGRDASILKQFITKPVGRPPQEKDIGRRTF